MYLGNVKDETMFQVRGRPLLPEEKRAERAKNERFFLAARQPCGKPRPAGEISAHWQAVTVTALNQWQSSPRELSHRVKFKFGGCGRRPKSLKRSSLRSFRLVSTLPQTRLRARPGLRLACEPQARGRHGCSGPRAGTVTTMTAGEVELHKLKKP
jgi:hypothetical protein